MSRTGFSLIALAVGAAAIALAGCGRSSTPLDSAAGASGAAAKPQETEASDAAAGGKPAITSAAVCQLLSAAEVRAILGASPNATPQDEPAAGEVSQSRCVWDAGGGNGDLTLAVLQAHGGTQAMILNSMPMEGDALSGLGDQAGVTVQGNYNVEVMARIGPRVMTLEASAVGVTDRKDAVVAAARSVASKLE